MVVVLALYVCCLFTKVVWRVVVYASSIINFNVNIIGNGTAMATKQWFFPVFVAAIDQFFVHFCCCIRWPWNLLFLASRENPYSIQTRRVVRIHQYPCCWIKLKRYSLFLSIVAVWTVWKVVIYTVVIQYFEQHNKNYMAKILWRWWTQQGKCVCLWRKKVILLWCKCIKCMRVIYRTLPQVWPLFY